MHELSVCLALIESVERIAAERGARAVHVIHVRIGPLSGIEPDLLRNAYPLAATGTVAAGSRLDLTTADLVVRCTQCEQESTVVVNRLLCAHCGDFRTRVVSGDELLLERVELSS
jgi:hydrogenase nickel incorporation protein HypA/HybF